MRNHRTALLVGAFLFLAVADLPLAAKSPRIGPILDQVAEAAEAAMTAGSLTLGGRLTLDLLPQSVQDAATAGLLSLDKAGMVQVIVHLERGSARRSIESLMPEEVLTSMRDELGVQIERRDDARGLVQARVPATSLRPLSQREGIRFIGLPLVAVAETGVRLTEGDAALRAATARSAWGLGGAGVRVGVISDGIFGLADAITSGDLPPTTFTRTGAKLTATSGGVTATSFRADADLEAGLGSGRGAEGTAMLEIIHDLAPAAQLHFANFKTDLEFNAAVNWLASRTDVLVDDISFFGGPYDGTSAVSANAAAAMTNPANPVRAFFTSTGNRAQDHWEEPWASSGVDGASTVGAPGKFQLFAATSKTDDAQGLGPFDANQIFLFRNQTVTLILTWDDPPGASANDYDLYLFKHSNGQLVGFGAAAQTGHEDPVEVLVLTNLGTQGLFNVRVQNYLDAAAPRNLEIFVVESPFRAVFPNGATLNYNTMAGSIPDMADAGGGVISVGAIDAADSGLDDIEPFSSHGPTNDGRLKPEIVSVDRVSVTGSGGFPTTFAGTSAAAPHAAGVAALLLQQAPCLLADPGETNAADERAALRNVIFNRAIDLGAPGPDQIYGYGRNDAFAAGEAMLPVAEAGAAEIRTECTSPAGATVMLDGSASTAFRPDCPLTYRWSGPFATVAGPMQTVNLPLGQHDVTLEVSQNGLTQVPDLQRVIVEDTTPPTVNLSVSPSVLWPPNHRMVDVQIESSVYDLCGQVPFGFVGDYFSSEPDDAPGGGDGHTTGDIYLPDPEAGLPVQVRAERSGEGAGRIYTFRVGVVVFTVPPTPVQYSEAHVMVPHDLGSIPGAFEPLTLAFRNATTLAWSEVPWSSGYKVVRGLLEPRATLASMTASTITLAAGECIASGASAFTRETSDSSIPPRGRAFYYIAGYTDATGFTGFGSTDAIKDRQVAAPGCP